MRDGNVFTGGGVTAGIDFALTVAAEVAGAEAAQRIQLSIEYDPAPPFDSGSPDRAPASVRAGLAPAYETAGGGVPRRAGAGDARLMAADPMLSAARPKRACSQACGRNCTSH